MEDDMNARASPARMDIANRVWFEAMIEYNTRFDPPEPPILIENQVDGDPHPPIEFHYSNDMWHSEHVPPPTRKGLIHCNCVGNCSSEKNRLTCACFKAHQDRMLANRYEPVLIYNDDRRLRQPDLQFRIDECNDSCRCTDDCTNRVVQLGRKVAVNLCKTAEKGWGEFSSILVITK